MAGLSTGIGSLIALVAKRTNRKFLSFSLGFSAGVMIYISFVDLFPQSIEILGADYGARGGQIATAIAFFCGILFIALIDKLVPSVENPHEMRSIESLQVDLPAAGRHEEMAQYVIRQMDRCFRRGKAVEEASSVAV